MSPSLFLDSAATPWLIYALIALGIEFMTGTLYLLVFAIALAGGGIAALLAASNPGQFIAASVCGAGALAAVTAWKRRERGHIPAPNIDDPDIGMPVRVTSIDPAAPSRARVFYRGAEWDARLIDPAPEAGQEGIIVGRDGNELHISIQPTEGS